MSHPGWAGSDYLFLNNVEDVQQAEDNRVERWSAGLWSSTVLLPYPTISPRTPVTVEFSNKGNIQEGIAVCTTVGTEGFRSIFHTNGT